MDDQQFKAPLESAVNSPVWVIKIGSAILTDYGKTIDRALITALAQQISQLRQAGKQVILVSSGAIAAGIQKLGWAEKPSALPKQQAAAAVGQAVLARVYEEIFFTQGIQTAQILLTHEDAADRKRYLNIRATVNALLDSGILPIVNENDTVSFDEIRFGDNDNLGAMVANLTHAGMYVILTDQNGLYDADPREHSSAKLVRYDFADNPMLDTYIGQSKSTLGSGGMLTKLQAARKAMNSGTATAITHGYRTNNIVSLLTGDFEGTLLFSHQGVPAKKQWLASQLQTRGTLIVDEGAAQALLAQGKSLLSIGIVRIAGHFPRGAIVSVVDNKGIEIAKGIVNYGSQDLEKIIGIPSYEIANVLGFVLEKHIIHRDNLALVSG